MSFLMFRVPEQGVILSPFLILLPEEELPLFYAIQIG